MSTPQEGLLLRVFLGETDGLMPLYEWIVREAKGRGLAGATVLRGFEGFGSHGVIHTAKIFRLTTDQPVVVEIVDISEKVEAFIPVLDEGIPEGLATFQRVQVRFYRRGKESPSERIR